MRGRILALSAFAAFIATACSGGSTAPTRMASLRVAISPNPLASAPIGDPIFFDAVWSEVAGVGVTIKSDSARLIDANGNVLPGAIRTCLSGPPCALPPIHIPAYNSSGIRGRGIKVLTATPIRLEYTVEGEDDTGHAVSVSLQVPVQ
jgi:hypothetical protein